MSRNRVQEGDKFIACFDAAGQCQWLERETTTPFSQAASFQNVIQNQFLINSGYQKVEKNSWDRIFDVSTLTHPNAFGNVTHKQTSFEKFPTSYL